MELNPTLYSKRVFFNVDEEMKASALLDKDVKTLLKIEMRDADGVIMSSFDARKKLAKVPNDVRDKAIRHVLDLFELGVPGAEVSTVLDFFIETPENRIHSILSIAKSGFFCYKNKEENRKLLDRTNEEEFDPDKYNYGMSTDPHCISVLKDISKKYCANNFSEEQVKAFDNLKGHNNEKSFLYNILFGDQDCIRHFAFDFVQGKYHLFQWMKELVQGTDRQPLFEQWVSENPQCTAFQQSCEDLKLLNQQVRKLYSDENPSLYITNLTKPFPKNLIARSIPANDAIRSQAKKAIHCFLAAKFNSNEPESIRYIPCNSHTLFEVEKNKYRVSTGGDLMKNGEKKIDLSYDERDLLDERLLAYLLNGDRLEHVKVNTQWRGQQPDEFWDSWAEIPETKAIYQDQIDPMIAQAVFTILGSKYWETPAVILDIGGGTGRLANTLLQYGKLDYILLEKNQEEIRQAKDLLKERAAVVPTDIVQDPFFCRDEAKTMPLQPASVDIAIASGVLTHKVLKDKEEALNAFKKVSSSIKLGGFILLTGVNNSFITSADLKAKGFEVINMSLPQSLRQFYIAQKNG